MRRHALRVSALRSQQVPRIPVDPRTPQDVLSAPSNFALSRRQALGLAGILAVTAAPLAGAVESALSQTFTVKRRGTRIAFLVAGIERWVIDPQQFDGNPTVTYASTKDKTLVTLHDATYPGTNVRADMVATIDLGATPSISIHFVKLDVSVKAAFVPWLLDRVVAVGTASLHHTFQCGEAGAEVSADKRTADAVSFRPMWALTLSGRTTTRLSALTLPSQSVTISLLAKDAPTLFTKAAVRRSLLRISRGTNEWDTPLALSGAERWSFDVRGDAFSTVSVESASDGRCAVLLEGATDGAVRLSARDNDVFMPLRNARYAWTRTEEGLHEAFVARYSTTPFWHSVAGFSMELGDREALPPLEIVSTNGRVDKLNIAPALLRYAVPVDGAVTEPTVAHGAAQCAFLTADVRASALPKPNFHMVGVNVDAPQDFNVKSLKMQDLKGDPPTFSVKKKEARWLLSDAKLITPASMRVSVIRPDDLLVLTFEFVNITVNAAAGTFSSNGNGAILIVHFQPQHIAERAFFYTEDKPVKNVGFKASSPTGSAEPLLDPPIDAILAHDSRLAFRVPNGYRGTMSIEGLLDWSKFEMSVSPAAKPPAMDHILTMIDSAFVSKYSFEVGGATKNAKPGTRIKGKTNINAFASPKVSMQIGAEAAVMKRVDLKDRFETSSDFRAAIPVDMMTSIIAAYNEKPPIKNPSATETSIEYPYRLMLSPNKYAGWAHATKPVWNPSNHRAELWHTRLGVRNSDGTVSETSSALRTVRAVWSPDYGVDYAMSPVYRERPFRTSINRRDRHEIVQLTSDYNLVETKIAPINVNRMMLTSLGAWMDSAGAWDPKNEGSTKLDVEGWIQRGAQGRDSFVRISYKGFLFPFGNRATLLKETERKFRRTPRGHMAAYLMQRMYIIVREPVRDFPAAGIPGMKYLGREFPFRRVTITTKQTPNLELPVTVYPSFSPNSFWPKFTNNGSIVDMQWSCIGTDWDNKNVQFSAPLAFIANGDATSNAAGDLTKMTNFIANSYNGMTAQRSLNMQGQSIALAPSVKLGDTSMPTTTFMLHGYTAEGAPNNEVQFFPRMERADIKIDKVQELLGTDATKSISYFDQYLKHAFETGVNVAQGGTPNINDVLNPSQIFAKLTSPLTMAFSGASDKSGGLGAPDINISGLSRLMGPIAGDLTNVVDSAIAIGNFDPMQYFQNMLNAKILGDITLSYVLKFVSGVLDNLDKMPGLDKKDAFMDTDAAKSATDAANEIKSQALALKAEAEKLANDIDSEVKAARDALIAKVNDIKTEIEGYINDGKKIVEDRINEWKKIVNDKANELKSEIDKVLGPLKEAGNEAYKKYEEVNSLINTLKQGLQLVYEWSTEIKGSPGNILVPLNPSATNKDDKAILYLKASFTKKLDLNPPDVRIYGSLSNFVINLIGDGAAQFLIIKFNRLSFSATIGQKPQVDPDIKEVAFAGPLTFVNKLKDLIPKGGSAGGVGFSFDVNVLPSGITAQLTIGLPNVTIGVLSLQNMAFIMRITIPFDGRPFSAYFAFCTKESPFRLTVMVFAGGGFFGIEVTPSGVKMLEAALEFGGNFAFDCGVASGGASVMAGIYYKLEKKSTPDGDKDYSELTAYFRLQGHLSVLGLIHVSLLFELKLTWQNNGKLFGVATVEVEISILFLSFSVGVTVERQLKGSDGDPTFQQMLPTQNLWLTYCEAFA
ncbi:hypothetical protein BH10BAC6_BH10BAC6_00710 [soil metagenome]